MSISQNFPNIDPTLRLNFQSARRLDPRITFTRASTGTYVDEDGLIKTAAADEARFDHDPDTGESLGLLIEEGRTNLVATSIPSGYSTFNRATQTTGITAPDGSTSARNYNNTGDPSGNGADFIFTNFNTSFATGTQYVISIFSTYSEMDITQGGLASGKYTSVNSTQHISYPNGWYRHWRIYQASVDNPNITPQIVISTTATAQSNQSLWGLQVEVGSFPTSYMPTSGSTFTRQPDNAQITGTNLTSFYNQSEGTILSVHKLLGLNGTGGFFQNVYAIDDGTTTNRIWLYARGGSNDIQFIGGDFSIVTGLNSPNTLYKSAGAYKTNDVAFYVDGTFYGSDNTTTPPAVTTFGIGRRNDPSSRLSGHLKQLIYYPERLTNTQLQNLTK